MTVVEMGMLIHRVLSLVFYLCMHDLEKIEYPQNLEQFGHSCSDANNSFTCQSDDSFFLSLLILSLCIFQSTSLN